VIPAYNSAEYVVAAARSALEQTRPPAEVIVVDDGSTDGTQEVLRELGNEIRVISQENAGVAAARNRGFAEARGDFVGVLDADDLWLPRKLELQLERFDADPELGIVHCGLRYVDEGLRTLRDQSTGHEGWIAHDMLVARDRLHPGGTTSLIAKTAFEAVGGYDPRLPPAEDWDLAYRIARLYRVAFVPEVLAVYRQHGTNAHHDTPRMARGLFGGYEKAFDTDDEAVLALRQRAYAGLHIATAGSYWYAGERGPFLRHTIAALRHRPAASVYVVGMPMRRLRRRFRPSG
jgi:glycosyltransferase involved in cell wall biosynthesis